MQIKPQEILDLLKNTPLFAHLLPETLLPVAQVMAVEVLRKGDIIFDFGDPAEALFVVYEGQAGLSFPENRQDTGITRLQRGDIFGEEALLFDDPRYYRAEAQTDCVLLALSAADYLALYAHLPGVEQRLDILIQSRELASKQALPWLQDDEHVHVITRRHPAVLWGKIALPILMAFMVILVSLLTQLSWLPGKPYGWLLLALGLSLCTGWLVWRIIDWRNDFFIVTNKRVVWLEKVALVYESRQEAPLSTIMSVGLQRSRIGAVLGFADVVVTTYVGTIRLRDLARAETIAGLIEIVLAPCEIL